MASKHAVVGMMREWAISLGHLNIRVNTIHPTGVLTPMVINEAFGRYISEHGTFETVNHVLPVGSLQPEDVADTVAFLVSDAARYITGQTLSIDAGVNIR
ncbi:MAG: SDR family oxidoreductase [Actinobacteria bacterium]|nr:SDR family oxidoreductase [Actinomycetota bacterium]